MPAPRGRDDGFDVVEFDLPAKFLNGFGGIRVELGRVSGAARGERVGYFQAGDVFHGADDLKHRSRFARAEIVKERGAGFFELLKHCAVGAAQIVDVDVVTQTRAVGRGIIVAENVQRGALARGGLDREGNQV